ncbi:glycosyl hydrolase family 28-related protein [Virgibacillus halodenitrificans]|uniref:glycosyl hydrolase family 28-related protein n=1 Tax=Virgibacillus halodenitrificans TaxID=1482 RepID=UPI00136E4E55|nr:glycosyl hydrolase family 28-related protein [Virgibacillus halodenitrificans]
MNINIHRNKLIILSLLILCIIILIKSTNHNEENLDSTVQVGNSTNQINVETFNAVGNDDTDDTEFIQNAIDSLFPEGGNVYFPKGTYLVDAVKSINLRDNITLNFEEGAVIKVKPNDRESYVIFKIHNISHVSIKGNLKMVGERDEHIGNSGEWGFGISIRGSENILVEDVRIENMWGDAIYIGGTEVQNYSENVVISNTKLNNNRRQGISVISAINLTILNPVITNTRGTSPSAGIDLEPNTQTEKMKDISIINMKSFNNKGGGIVISLKNLKNTHDHVNIMIHNTKGIKDGVRTYKPKDLRGIIKVGKEYKHNRF